MWALIQQVWFGLRFYIFNKLQGDTYTLDHTLHSKVPAESKESDLTWYLPGIKHLTGHFFTIFQFSVT